MKLLGLSSSFLLLLLGEAAAARLHHSSTPPQFPVLPVTQPQQHSSRRSSLAHAPNVPSAFVGGIIQGIGNTANRLKEGTQELWRNAKQLGALKKRHSQGESLSFEEYNLMQKTSGDLAKFVGLALFTMSKPEFTPFLCSFFPAVVPSTYLSSDDKLQRCQQRNFGRVRGVVNHLMSLQQETVAPHKKESDRMRHLRTMENLLRTTKKEGAAQALKQVGSTEGVLFTSQTTDRKGRPKADLRGVPRPFLVSVCNAIGMFNKFVPAAALRVMLGDYLFKINESDQILLLQTNVDKLGRDDLLDACAQRALSLGDATPAAMRANLKAYLKTISRPGLTAPKQVKGEEEEVELNENNLRFALLGLNMVGLVRDARENSALRALFGCA